jgi:hypothetical protein
MGIVIVFEKCCVSSILRAQLRVYGQPAGVLAGSGQPQAASGLTATRPGRRHYRHIMTIQAALGAALR